ncbi:amino acid adenylation domain-containing protein [Streptomyces sp. bgisy159]|uniref:amino acid adenylation domain-containing protein n=1 Tax=Streptomyces sp. bgisy159 TaxID=3413795 RepID=UPI003F4A6E45
MNTSIEETLAAVVAALYRRTLQERITVGCLVTEGPETREGCAEFEADASETFAGLVTQAGKALVDLGDQARTGGESPEPTVWFSGVPADPEGRAENRPLVRLAADGTVEVSGGHGQEWEPGETELFEHVVRAVLSAGRAALGTPLAQLRLTSPDTNTDGFWGSAQAPEQAVRLNELIAEQAARGPREPAVSHAGQSLSREELDRRARALAAALQAQGVGPESVVAVLMERSLDLIVTLLAVLKSGAAYLALSPDDPAPRLAALTEDAGVRVAVAPPGLAGLVPEGIAVLDPADHTVEAEAFVPPTGLTPDHLAYLCYTSGSTGEPKGVGVPHRAVSRLVRGTDWVDIRPDDVFLHLSPVSFDAATFEIFGALVNGCRLAVLPAGRIEMEQLATTVRDEQVSVLLLPTGLLHATIASRIDVFTGVRHVLTGGDVASAPHVRQLFEAHPGVVYTNGYGPTENTTYTTCWTSDTPPPGASVPIGAPVSGTSVAILDAGLDPVPPGVAGELYTAGEGLARGYLNRPAATAARFLPHPSPRRPGERMYRTGDLARRRADGTVEYLGRADRQVKVRGYRVELGAVEEALTGCPEVSVAAVAAQDDGGTGQRLIAYVVPAESAASTTDPAALGTLLRDRLAARLPAYMVPWAVLVRPHLELNRNGKVDRRALPAVSRQPRTVWNEYVAPTTELEQRLADLWGQALGIEPVGVEDDFFDLGGHSLMAAELLSALHEQFGVDIPARTLYLRPTIAELATAIEAAAPTDG